MGRWVHDMQIWENRQKHCVLILLKGKLLDKIWTVLVWSMSDVLG